MSLSMGAETSRRPVWQTLPEFTGLVAEEALARAKSAWLLPTPWRWSRVPASARRHVLRCSWNQGGVGDATLTSAVQVIIAVPTGRTGATWSLAVLSTTDSRITLTLPLLAGSAVVCLLTVTAAADIIDTVRRGFRGCLKFWTQVDRKLLLQLKTLIHGCRLFLKPARHVCC